MEYLKLFCTQFTIEHSEGACPKRGGAMNMVELKDSVTAHGGRDVNSETI